MMENTFSSDVKVLVAVEYIVLFNEAAQYSAACNENNNTADSLFLSYLLADSGTGTILITIRIMLQPLPPLYFLHTLTVTLVGGFCDVSSSWSSSSPLTFNSSVHQMSS